MKVYTIGRSADCAIVLDDSMVSRRHALLKVYPFGKMELVDLSQNGTFLNGVKLKKNVPVPVTRKDVVKIAQTRVLDWTQVPNPMKNIWIALAIGAVIILLILISVLFSNKKDVIQERKGEMEEAVQEDNWYDKTKIPDKVESEESKDSKDKEKPIESKKIKDPIKIIEQLEKESSKSKVKQPGNSPKKTVKTKVKNEESFNPIL